MDNHQYTVEDFATDDRFVSWVLNNDPAAGAYWHQFLEDHPDARPVADRARILLLNLVQTQKRLNRRNQVDRLWENIDARTREYTPPVTDKDRPTENPHNGPAGANNPDNPSYADGRTGNRERSTSRDPISLNATGHAAVRDANYTANNDAANGASPERNGETRRQWVMIAAVSAIMVIVSVAVWVQSPQRSPESAPLHQAAAEGFIEHRNDTGGCDTVHFSDGTRVILENRSRLTYKRSYAGDSARNVFLEGEAFFAVARNPALPFLVHANEIVTRVLGTSFRVKAYAQESNVMVAVAEGKVSVYSTQSAAQQAGPRQPDVNGVVLTSNQQVVYTRNDNSFSKSLVDAPSPVHPTRREAVFAFKNANMSEVFGSLQEAYEVEILFPKEAMENCYLSVTLKDEPLFEKLTIICRTIGATYELIDGKVVIDSKGCR